MVAASLGFTICYVDDVEAVLHRFESAFGFNRRMLTEDGRYGELETGGTVWAFADREFGRDHFSDPKVRAAFRTHVCRVRIAHRRCAGGVCCSVCRRPGVSGPTEYS